jgi:signal transduction histidine kinase
MQGKLIVQERQAAAGELFQRVAHNIRNPLAGIRGLAEATSRSDAPAEEISAYQQRIIRAVDRLEKWLRDVQQTVAPVNINPQPTDLHELIENVRHVLAPMADRIGVAIVVAIDPAARYVMVDAFHFEQALVALITNAVQASHSGQTVRVRVAPVQDAADEWCVSVEDDGVGISPELRSKVFLPHFTTRPDGNGIGLAMAARVVHTHGGRMALESAPGAGSRFDAFMPGRSSSAARGTDSAQ